MAAVNTYKENYATGDVVTAAQFNNEHSYSLIFSTTSKGTRLTVVLKTVSFALLADDTIYQYRNSAWVTITNINDQVLSKFNAKDYTETTATLSSSSGVVALT